MLEPLGPVQDHVQQHEGQNREGKEFQDHEQDNEEQGFRFDAHGSPPRVVKENFCRQGWDAESFWAN
jgi:hypothetical protein